MENKDQTLSFEDSFAKLETIVEKMNAQKVSLDEALKLYEEADRLIASCQKRLTEAEQKIEILSKNQNGELMVNEQGVLMKAPFQPAIAASLKQNA